LTNFDKRVFKDNNLILSMGFYIIYKIYCNDCNDIYVGSTQNYSKRKSQHRINSRCSYDSVKKRLKLYKTINEYGGWDNWIMVPIEFCDESITTKRQAEQKEEEWRLKFNTTLNSRKAYTSEEEKKDRKKIWREENKDKVKEQKHEEYERNKDQYLERAKIYYEENKDKIKERSHEKYERNKDQYSERAKIYYEENKDKVKEQKHEYYEENKDKIKERRSQKIVCECGVTFSRDGIARHCRSKHHQNWINKENKEN
tara:strand:+ start:453 stop:1220 length:768 start_codon:yes stop_codon:yes gene_type:complete